MLYREMGKTGDKVSVLGFGCMRFQEINGRIDVQRTERQLLQAIDSGVNYFDTAYVYHGGKSESFLGEVFSKGIRNKVKIATKLPTYMVQSKRGMEEVLETQLERLKTDRIEYYLLHMLTDFASWKKMKSLGILDFLQKAKRDGKIIHTGFSFHGDRENFKLIVDDYDWDMCQIQYNYLDEYYQAGIEGLKYAASKGLGVVAMEPLRGGRLVGRIPAEVETIWSRAEIQRTPAEWAFRWVWNHPEVTMLLSGMNEETHICENIQTAGEAYPNSLPKEELAVVDRVKEVYQKLLKIGCTGCRYCMPCPSGVDIPNCLGIYNDKHLFHTKRTKMHYFLMTSGLVGGVPAYASLCTGCGKCEKVCPQHLEIRRHLKDVVRTMQYPAMKQLIWLVQWGMRGFDFFKKRNGSSIDS